jgi:hypothetical protein
LDRGKEKRGVDIHYFSLIYLSSHFLEGRNAVISSCQAGRIGRGLEQEQKKQKKRGEKVEKRDIVRKGTREE